MQIFKRSLKIVGWFLAIVVLLIGVYVIYVVANYYRIEDNVLIDVKNNPTQTIQLDQPYTAITYNLGFGAYDPEFSFFMDQALLREEVAGVGQSGQTIVGVNSTASNEATVSQLTSGAIETTGSVLATDVSLSNDSVDETLTLAWETAQPGFVLFQEIDISANRSYRVNQVEAVQNYYDEYASIYSSNFHTVWLQYPPFNPIGDIESGLLSVSPFHISSATRRSLPVSDAFPTKFFDLDRCFQVLRMPVQGSQFELILVNAHLSAYDQKGEFKKQQMQILADLMREEAQSGNYVIVGGDFNNAFAGSLTNFQNAEEIPDWIIELDESVLPSGYRAVNPSNSDKIASVRDSSFRYIQGSNYETITDGWLISDNVQANAEVVDTSYRYSDHNPVK
ncbi:MAG: hypothetical protein LBC43_03515, partial [Bifidobacteriaceae bacterium]|nr:hypothetical protein [Bifidobacteriaceae bacterium]